MLWVLWVHTSNVCLVWRWSPLGFSRYAISMPPSMSLNPNPSHHKPYLKPCLAPPPQVFSRHATSMSLCLLRRDGSGYLEMILDPAAHRTGDVWHVAVAGLKELKGLVYGFRANGPGTWAEGKREKRGGGDQEGCIGEEDKQWTHWMVSGVGPEKRSQGEGAMW